MYSYLHTLLCTCTLYLHTRTLSACSYADRLIAQETAAELAPFCGTALQPGQYPACNGTQGSVLMPVDSPSLFRVGRQPVYCPYYFWRTAAPVYAPGRSEPCGQWYSFPKAGGCRAAGAHIGSAGVGAGEADVASMVGVMGAGAEQNKAQGERQQEGACAWRAHPQSRVFYGAQLHEYGWDSRLSFDQRTGARLNTTAQTQANGEALRRALAAATGVYRRFFARARCCGC